MDGLSRSGPHRRSAVGSSQQSPASPASTSLPAFLAAHSGPSAATAADPLVGGVSLSLPLSLPLPLPLPPFCRPFTSAQRGLYQPCAWPLPEVAEPRGAGQRSRGRGDSGGEPGGGDGDGDGDWHGARGPSPALSSLSQASEPSSSSPPFSPFSSLARFAPPHTELPFARTASALLSSGEVAALPPPSPSGLAHPPDAALPLQGSALLALRLRWAASPTSALLLLVQAGGERRDELQLLAAPCDDSAAFASSASSAASLHLHDAVTLEAAIVRVTCSASDSRVATSTFSALRELPLLISATAAAAFVHRVGWRDGRFVLHLLDCLVASTPPLLCLAANVRLCSAAYCEVACVDAAGCIALWAMHVDHAEDGDSDEDRRRPALAAAHRRVTTALRSAYEEPQRPPIAQRPPLRFARCLFAPHPRSLVVAFEDHVVRVDLGSRGRPVRVQRAGEEGSAAAPFSCSALSLPRLSASSVPVNRHRLEPERPQELRDHFFRYQRYRQRSGPADIAGSTGRAEQADATNTAPRSNSEREWDDGALSDGASGPGALPMHATASPRRRRRVRARAEAQSTDAELPAEGAGADGADDGRVIDVCAIDGWPLTVAMVSTGFVMLLDLRHSTRPLVEWQLRAPLHRPCHLQAVTVDDIARSSLFLTVWDAAAAEATLYHCVLRAEGAAASPSVIFAPIRLSSFPHVASPTPRASSLVRPTRKALLGVAVLVLGSSGAAAALPSLRVVQRAAGGVLLCQDWRTDRAQPFGEAAVGVGEGEPTDRVGGMRPARISAADPAAISASQTAEEPPPWLHRSTANPCDVVDLSPLFYGPLAFIAPLARSQSALLLSCDPSTRGCLFTTECSRPVRPAIPLSSGSVRRTSSHIYSPLPLPWCTRPTSRAEALPRCPVRCVALQAQPLPRCRRPRRRGPQSTSCGRAPRSAAQRCRRSSTVRAALSTSQCTSSPRDG